MGKDRMGYTEVDLLQDLIDEIEKHRGCPEPHAFCFNMVWDTYLDVKRRLGEIHHA